MSDRRHFGTRLTALLLAVQMLSPAPAAAVTDGSTNIGDRGGSGRPEQTSAADSAAGADPFSGTANFSLPIAVAPGAGGLTPRVALSYSSSSRASTWVGRGWSLSPGVIHRSLKDGTPRLVGGVPGFDDATDTFLFGGGELVEDLVVPGRYHTRQESFLRIDRVGDTWEVRTKGGHVKRFGVTASARVASSLEGGPTGLTVAWLLSEEEDPNGNVILYSYDDTIDSGNPHLTEIRYTLRRVGGSFVSLNGSPAPQPTIDRVVSFETESRPDHTLAYNEGLARRQTRRLKAINVKAGGALIRRYELAYVVSPDSGISMLGSVSQFGTDGELANPAARTPPLTHGFSYQFNDTGVPATSRAGWGTTDPDLPVSDPARNASYWVLPNNVWFVLSDRKDNGTRLADLNGDGFVDALREVRINDATSNDSTSGAYMNGRWGFVNTVPPTEPPRDDPQTSSHRLPLSAVETVGTAPVQLNFVRNRTPGTDQVESDGLALLDFNGDGRSDLLRLVRGQRVSATAEVAHEFVTYEYHVRTPTGWQLVGFKHRPEGGSSYVGDLLNSDYPALVYSHGDHVDKTNESTQLAHKVGGRTEIADLNGDGRPDLITRGIEYWVNPSTGQVLSYDFGDLFHAHLSDADGFAPYDFRSGLPAFEGESVEEATLRLDISGVAWGGGFFSGQLTLFQTEYGRLGKRYVDVNADGLADHVTALDNSSPNFDPRATHLSRGSFLNPTPDAAWVLPTGVYLDRNDAGQISRDEGYRFVDINGDGRVDLVRATQSTKKVWLGTANPNGPWVELASNHPWQIPSGLHFVNSDGQDLGVRFADMNGDGLVDLIRSMEGSSIDVRLNQGRTPDLLVAVANPQGGATRITYGPSTAYDNNGIDGVPDLPSVLQVVTAIEVDDGNGNVDRKTFSYEGGAYDPVLEETLGFAETRETRVADGRLTVMRFHQDEARRGRPESREIYSGTGQLWQRSAFTYRTTPVAPFVALPEHADTYEHDGSSATSRHTRITNRYDGDADGTAPITYGNQTAEILWGEVNASGQPLLPALVRHTSFTHAAPNTSAYIIDRVSRREQRAGAVPGAGQLLRRSTFFYDYDLSGTAPPTSGLVTRRLDHLPATGGSGPTTTFSYDGYGNLLTTTNPRANAGEVSPAQGTTTLTYDTTFQTYVRTRSNGLGHQTVYGYQPTASCSVQQPAGAGLVHTLQQPNDTANTAALRCYDVFGRATLDRAANDLQETRTTYNDLVFPETVTREVRARVSPSVTHRVSVTSFDGLGRAIQVRANGANGQTTVQTHTYDAAGRLLREGETIFEGQPAREATFAYDPLDRVISVTRQGARVTAMARFQGTLTTTDPNLNATVSKSNAFGQMVEVIEPGGSATDKTVYGYKLTGELATVVDRRSNLTTIFYDDLGRRTSINDPDAGLATFDLYDANGNLKQQSSGGVITAFTYDPLDRIKTRSAGTSSATWNYDTATLGVGMLGSRVDPSGTLRLHEYDHLGRVKREERLLDGRSFEFLTSFDPLGQIQTRTYPTGRVLQRDYDSRGYLTGVRNASGSAYATLVQWEADGRPRQHLAANGNRSSYVYDGTTGRLDRIELRNPSNALVEDLDLGFDPGDRLQTIASNSFGSFSFQHDALNRLTQATGPYAPGWASQTLYYGYDVIGNLTCRASVAPLPTCDTSSNGAQLVYPSTTGAPRPHAPTQVNGAAALYSPRGSLTSLATRSYEYDAFERLVAVRGSGTLLSEFVYDAGGDRVKTTDRTGRRAEIRYDVSDDFEWDEARGLARTHVYVLGQRVATQIEPYVPPSGSAMLPGAPSEPDWIAKALASCTGLAALLLLLQLLGRRRNGLRVLRPALAGSTAIVFFVVTTGLAIGEIPDGDLDDDGALTAGDALRALRAVAGQVALSAGEAERADVAPLNGTSNGSVDSGDALLILRALSNEDLDGDTLVNADELEAGASPFRADTDGDGLDDGTEVELGTDPADADSDDDGLSDGVEVAGVSDPLTVDTDGDGTPDAADANPAEGVVFRFGDHLGSTASVRDAAGAVIHQAVYRPFGGTVPKIVGSPATTPEFGFTGQRFERSAGIYDYGARWYDPALGRFLQADSIVPDPGTPQVLNRYSYVNNNPVTLSDPSGNFAIDLGIGFGTVGYDSTDTTMSSFGSFSFTSGSSFGFGFSTGSLRGETGVGFSAFAGFGAGGRPFGDVNGFANTLDWSQGQHPVIDWLIGEGGGAAWRAAFTENWIEGPTGGLMPESLAAGIDDVLATLPDSSVANGMHSWHSGSNAFLAQRLGLIGALAMFAGGIYHETPLDWRSFMGEQESQGSVNHLLDSLTDISANLFGMGVGYLDFTDDAVGHAVVWGNYIPGPGEPDPQFGGAGVYQGDPADAWGQYP